VPLTAVVTGVLGNTAANNADPGPGTTAGFPMGVVLTAVDSTHLAISCVDPNLGTIVPIIGNGSYAGGGTIQFAFVDGSILVGREHLLEASAPPRIVFVPLRSSFSAKSPANRRNSASLGELNRQIQQRPIETEEIFFEVHSWGQANPPDPAGDFDATQALYQSVIQVVHAIAEGVHEFSSGGWTDQAPNATQLVKAGHEHVFGLSLKTPILDVLTPFIPVGTVPSATIKIQPPDGSAPESP
jgi:hypothetical protein